MDDKEVKTGLLKLLSFYVTNSGVEDISDVATAVTRAIEIIDMNSVQTDIVKEGE